MKYNLTTVKGIVFLIIPFLLGGCFGKYYYNTEQYFSPGFFFKER